MLAPTGRCQSTALCALRLGYRHAARIRRYTSSGNNNSADPADPAQHETPGHAKSVGVPPSHHRPAGATMALVPMNIIYLPPPKWHQPLRPLPTPGRPAPDMPTTEPNINNTTAKTFVPESEVGDQTSKVADSHDVHPTGAIRRLIARLFVRAEPPADKPSTETPDKAQPTKTPATDGPVADGPSKAQQVSEAAAAAAEAASERWRHAVGSARQKVDALRQLPQDDDWATWLGKALNQLTGYDRIAEHKQRVQDSGTAFHNARQHLTAIKTHHAQVIQSRMAGQREINSLLQRKHLWNDDDVARFTGLYRAEHQAEASEQSASQELRDTEALVDQKYDQLVAAIRDRYHEEQIWSDKIRRASTYGTWAVLFMNIIALFLAQAIFEPRKRRKIVAGVDERLSAAMGEQQARVADIGLNVEQRMAAHESSIAAIAAHLASVSATLATVASRQETEMTVLGSQLLGPSAGNGSAVDVADLMKLGGDGYSDTELDMYYAQQYDSRRLLQRLIPGSMIWRAVKPSDATQATFSRAEAGQLALESAAVALAVGLATAAVYFSA